MATLGEPLDLAISFKDVKLIEQTTSDKQRLGLWRHPRLGLVFVIEDEVQHVEAWQALYHEPLVHIPSAFVPNIQTALILGGGSLFAAAQVLEYPTVVSCTLVDHDHAVLDLAARHYEHAQHVRSDSRFTFVEADMVNFLSTTSQSFDIVINDGIDTMRAPQEGTNSIHAMMRNVCTPEGVCADVIYRHIFEIEHGRAVRATLEQLGTYVMAPIVVPEYPGILHLLTIWGNPGLTQDLAQPINSVQRAWSRTGNKHLEFYNPRYLKFCLYLPPYIRRIWSSRATI